MRRVEHRPTQAGFTLVEVLIAMAITAFVSVLSYQTCLLYTSPSPRDA